MKAYNAVMMGFLSYANRTSYIIAPDGHIIYEYTGLDPSNHVEIRWRRYGAGNQNRNKVRGEFLIGVKTWPAA